MRRAFVLVSLCFCGFTFSANGQSVDTLFIHAAHAKLRNAAEYTLEIARLMPEDRYTYKPSSSEMSFAQQLTHLSRNLGWLSAHYVGNKEVNPVSDLDLKLHNKDSILAVVQRSYNYALDKLKHFSPENLSDTVPFFAGPLTKLQIINLINDHQTHHRGQLVVYLRMNGIKPPSYIGW